MKFVWMSYSRGHPFTQFRPVKNIFWEWNVAISWQLRGLSGCYGVYVQLFFAKIALRGSYGTDLREDVAVAIGSFRRATQEATNLDGTAFFGPLCLTSAFANERRSSAVYM